MIPELADNVLPEGIHDCDMDEVTKCFGQFARSDRRIRLTAKLRQFVEEARKSGICVAVVIDGSYVTGKDEPEDIDMVLALKPDVDESRELTPFEYSIRSKRLVKQNYGFDLFAAKEGTDRYNALIDFFCQVRPDDPAQATNRSHKGLLRVKL